MTFRQIGASYIFHVIGNKRRHATYHSDHSLTNSRYRSNHFLCWDILISQCLRSFFRQIAILLLLSLPSRQLMPQLQ
jgi:hypothetical protein